MNAKEAALAAQKAKLENAARKAAEEKAEWEAYIQEAIGDARKEIAKAVNAGERYCTSDVFLVWDDPNALARVMRPLKDDGYKVEYHEGIGRDFGENREWTTHYLRIEW